MGSNATLNKLGYLMTCVFSSYESWTNAISLSTITRAHKNQLTAIISLFLILTLDYAISHRSISKLSAMEFDIYFPYWIFVRKYRELLLPHDNSTFWLLLLWVLLLNWCSKSKKSLACNSMNIPKSHAFCKIIWIRIGLHF